MLESLFSLEGKHALITGGTGGLGKGIASMFLAAGAEVTVLGLHPEKMDAFSNLDESLKNRLHFMRCDITDAKDVDQMLENIASTIGHLEILVNSAGMNKLLLAEEYDDETFNRVLQLNIHALHRVSREVGKRFMIPASYGRIINLSSVKSIIGTTENYAAYCASKGAVNMYTKQLACEWGKHHITCNAIAPTFVRTPINAFQLDDPVFYNTLTRRIPLGRIGKEEDVAAAALYLASDAASFVSGQVLCVDGGLTAMQ